MVKHSLTDGENEETSRDQLAKIVDFKESSKETSMSLAQQTGKIDKFTDILAWHKAQGKSGCVSLKKWGRGGPTSIHSHSSTEQISSSCPISSDDMHSL